MKVILMLATAALLSACLRFETGTRSAPEIDSGISDRDRATCRGDANRRAERDFLRETSRVDQSVFSTGQSLETNLLRIDAERYRRRLYEECLRNLGYQNEPPAGKSPAGKGTR